MSGYVVDASVAVKWVVDEPLSPAAARLLDDELTLLAPELIFAEAANALWAMARRGAIAAGDVQDALRLLADAPVVVPATLRELTTAAAKLADDLDHPVYDCVYLALAIREQRPVITADRRFHDVVKAHPYLGDRIVWLGDLP